MLVNPLPVKFTAGAVFRLQAVCLGIAASVFAVFWAIGDSPNLVTTLTYSLILGNAAFVMQAAITQRCPRGGVRNSLLQFFVSLLFFVPIMVTFATLVVFWIDRNRDEGHYLAPGITFGQYLQNSWKFPTVATLIFAVVMQVYERMRRRLEADKAELQQTVELQSTQSRKQTEELEQAREIQQALLPKCIPQIAGFEIAATWVPARVVGGDYYDVIALSPTKVAICIADVVGKGVAAALLMANVQAIVRAFSTATATPSEVCSRTNSVLCSNIATGKFVTMFYGVLDSERRTLEYTNAGHLLPQIVTAHGAIRSLANDGAVLGVFPDWSYTDSTVEIARGDRLLLFTDGITEAPESSGEEFGEERLLTIACREHASSASTLQEHVMRAVHDFSKGEQFDDATLLVIAANLCPAYLRLTRNGAPRPDRASKL